MTGNTSELTTLAVIYGPFLFAILFVTVLTGIAQAAYRNAHNDEERGTFRLYFLASFIFGLLLVSICVGWWVYDRVKQQEFVYTVTIENVPETVQFVSTEATCVQTYPLNGSPEPLGTVKAVFIRTSRLLPGDKLLLKEFPKSSFNTNPTPISRYLQVSGPDIDLDFSDVDPLQVTSSKVQ